MYDEENQDEEMDYFHQIANEHIKRIHEMEELAAMKSKFINLRPLGNYYTHRVQNGLDGYYELYDSEKRFIQNCDDGELQEAIRFFEEKGA